MKRHLTAATIALGMAMWWPFLRTSITGFLFVSGSLPGGYACFVSIALAVLAVSVLAPPRVADAPLSWRAAVPVAGILAMVVACTSIGCLLSWLRLRSGSVWPCAIAHGAINAIANVGLIFCTAGPTLAGPSSLGLVGGIPTMVLAVACWLQLSVDGPVDHRG